MLTSEDKDQCPGDAVVRSVTLPRTSLYLIEYFFFSWAVNHNDTCENHTYTKYTIVIRGEQENSIGSRLANYGNQRRAVKEAEEHVDNCFVTLRSLVL